MMEVWRVDLKRKKLERESIPENWKKLGGRGLLAQVMLDEVTPTCDPLGERNKLILAPGLFAGYKLSSCDRISIGAKSPLTQGIKESNAGGNTALYLANLGIKVLILEDKPIGDEWSILNIKADGVGFEPANNLLGKGVYESATALLERYGADVAIALIGPAGEMLLSGAGIQNLDKDRIPSRIAARGGLGAVMGSKKIKAIVFEKLERINLPVADRKSYREMQKAYTDALIKHPQTQVYVDYSTLAMMEKANAFGVLPVRNFSEGEFEEIEKINGEYLRELLLERGGASNPTHACMAGCVIRCSNVYGDNDGKTIVSPIEYETVGLMGSNLSIADLDVIARLNWEANDLGLDTIELGAALGVAAEAGLMEFGNGERALELIQEIRNGSPLGRILGNGAVITGKVFGVQRVPAVKGLAMSAYDPRTLKGTGVTYATSPQGADHTCGLTISAKIDHLESEGQVELSRIAQMKMAGYDTLGACIMAGFGFASAPESIPGLLNAMYGWNAEDDVLIELGRVTLNLERKFNQQAGFTQTDDRLPEWMTRESLPPHDVTFDVPNSELDELFNW
jgi:aldehyde:ferredoxin oxidoreductase